MKHTKTFVSIIALSFGIGLLACGGDSGGVPQQTIPKAEQTARQTQKITGGQNDDSGPANDFVVKMGIPGGGHGCTGTLVTSSLVLTASHCFSGEDGNVEDIIVGANLVFGVTNKIQSEAGEKERSAPTKERSKIVNFKTFTDPKSPTNELKASKDLAVARIFPPIVAQAFARKPQFVFPQPPINSFFSGDFSAIGYGLLQEEPKKIALIRQIFAETFLFKIQSGFVEGAAIVGNSVMLSGDSGGPLFIKNENDEFHQVGVASQFVSGIFARWTTIDSTENRNFIEDNAKDPLRPGKWIGETDYVGPCQVENDPDCDRFFDIIPGTQTWGSDNCPGVYNPAQFSALDTNGNGLPDDGPLQDKDGDGIPDYCDTDPNCPRQLDQNDDDNDGVCNGLDPCPCSPFNNGLTDASGDKDLDNACDTCGGESPFCVDYCTKHPVDTCPGVKNFQSKNANHESEKQHNALTQGDECEPVPVPILATVYQEQETKLIKTESGGSAGQAHLIRLKTSHELPPRESPDPIRTPFASSPDSASSFPLSRSLPHAA